MFGPFYFMANGNKQRKQLLQLYNHLYKRNYDLDQTKCVYCNASAACYDHQPPLAVCPSLNMKDCVKQGIKFLLLPACNECNAILRENYYIDRFECLSVLYTKYNIRLDKLPIWSKEELRQMSYHMQCIISNGQNKRNILIGKIAEIHVNMASYEGNI